MSAFQRAPAMLTCLIGLAFPVLFAQEPPKVPVLFRELETAKTTDRATEQLLKMGKSDAKVTQYLAIHLPLVIERNPQDSPEVWNNAVRLAGELRIKEAVPALAKWIRSSNAGTITFAQLERLETNAPGKALAQIGDPAVPTLIEVLRRGNLDERHVAARALNLVGSPRARKALRDHLKRESDLNLRDYIERILSR